MTVIDNSTEQELLRLWTIIGELSEELSRNRALSVSLYNHVGNAKNQATHSQTGFVLRRFNADKSKEAYESELERMNTAMAIENQSLQYDNKQLNALIKEYEQTLETLMSTFRNQARDVQERELSLIREYEAKLLTREEEFACQDLRSSTAVSASLARLSHVLRQLLRTIGGEEPEQRCTKSQEGVKEEEEEEDREPWHASIAAQQALERECELARLEKENEELKEMLELVGYDGRRPEPKMSFDPARMVASHSPRPSGSSSSSQDVAVDGPFGTVRPFNLMLLGD